MLVLSRFPGQEILVMLPEGKVLKIQVTSVSSGKVSLGFDAPKEIVILRKELYGTIPNKAKNKCK